MNKDEAQKIACRISNPDGTLKLEMTPNQLENWYNYLLTETPESHKGVPWAVKVVIHDMYYDRMGTIKIAKTLGLSRTVVENVLVNSKYNKLLSRVDHIAKFRGDKEEETWCYGGKLCP